jgi:hypothetical protein
MSFYSRLRSWKSALAPTPLAGTGRRPGRQAHRARLIGVERLEDRLVPAILPTHAVAGAYTLQGGDPFGETVRLQGNGSLDTGLLSDSGYVGGYGGTTYDPYSGEARGITTSYAQHFLGAYSSALGTGTGLFSPGGYGQGLAAWGDVAFLNSTNMPPALRLTFAVEAGLDAMNTATFGFVGMRAWITILRTTDDPRTFLDGLGVGYPNDGAAWLSKGTGPAVSAVGIFPWDSASFDGTSFHGTFHLDTPYNAALGGYGWGLGLYATSFAYGGTATADLLNTASLQSVTLTDGTPVDVTFDSGLSFSRQAVTSTALAVSAATPLAGVDPVALTATITVNTPGSGTPGGTVDFFDTTTATDLGSAPVVNGVASLNAGPFAAGGHAITATYSGDGNFLSSSATASLTALVPASLSGTVFADFNADGQVDFGEKGIGGVSVHLTGTDDLGHAVDRTLQTDSDGAYLFLNLRPGSYYLTRATQPAGYTAGVDSVGTAGGSLSTTVADQFFVTLSEGVNGLNYNYGERPAATAPVQKGQTAAIGFWNNKNGQALIKSLNGGTGTQLGDWLAATFVNLYGANSTNNLVGKSNAYVAALFQQDFLQKGQKLDAQVLATALSVYATNATLDSAGVAAKYGFTVSGDGVGTATFNVGSNGDAFGVANNTTLTVMDLLLATDAQAVNGILYNGNSTKRSEANALFDALNGAGGIG